MRWAIGLAALAGAAGATEAPPQQPPISMSAGSWSGTTSWRIGPDGAIRYEETGPGVAGGRSNGATPVVRTAPPSADRYRWVARMLAPLRGWAGKQLPCSDYRTDGGGGEIRWGAAVVRYDGGCLGPPTGRLLTRASEVAEQVARWAGARPPAH